MRVADLKRLLKPLGLRVSGRKAELTNHMLKVIDRVRVQLIREAGNDYQVTWQDVADQSEKQFRAKGLLSRGDEMWSAD